MRFRRILQTELIGKGFLKPDMDESVAGVSNLQTTLSFDQQKRTTTFADGA